MPIRLAQARLIPQDSRVPAPLRKGPCTCQRLHSSGTSHQDTLQMAGARLLIREKMLKHQLRPREIWHSQDHTPKHNLQPVLIG